MMMAPRLPPPPRRGLALAPALGLLLLLVARSTSALPQPVPSPSLAHFAAGPHGITMFQHFGLCTFADCQWDTQLAPASSFNPTPDIDTDQWMEAALLLGASQVCLTVRHVDGFCLWPTKTTNYSVASSPWRNGTGDVAADFVASARAYGISPCFYVILGFNIDANHSGVAPDVYLEQQRTVLTELAAYGPDRFWWDNYALDGRIYQPVTHEGFICDNNVNGPSCPAWNNVSSLVRELLPSALIIPGPDGCLIDAEQDGGTYPLYRSAPQGGYWCTNAGSPLPTNNASGPPTTFMGVEADYTIGMPGDDWFWSPTYPVLPAADLWSQVTLKHGQGANLILNIPPDTTGRVPDNIMATLAQYRATYDATYNVPPAAVLDFPVTGPCPGLTFTVPVAPGATFDQLETMEDMTVNGQVVDGYTVEALVGGAWTLLPVHGRTVGSRIRDYGLGTLAGVEQLRFNCTGSVEGVGPLVNATVLHFAAYLGAPIGG
jgi:alpha-L-fucosidase